WALCLLSNALPHAISILDCSSCPFFLAPLLADTLILKARLLN
ncbi:25201_t:CDS:2, partial [Gigaspora margarita]